MTTKINRRTALAGAAAGTLLPVAGLAQGTSEIPKLAAEPNATDAAWAELQAARAACDAELDRFHAFEDVIAEKVGRQPVFHRYDNREEWHAKNDAWRQARAQYPENPHLGDDNPFGERYNNALPAMLAAPVATVVDIERKLTLIHELSGEVEIEAEWIETILNGVRAMIGRAET